MTLSFHLHIATCEAVMQHYDPLRVHGCCSSCPHHGQLWSCPPFEVPPLLDFPEWDHAVLLFEKVWTAPGSTEEQMIRRFNESRRAFRISLLEAEGRYPEVTALVAGHCQVCAVCSRPAGSPCLVPCALRFSLEAVGFDVTGLAEGLAGQTILWPKTELPEYLVTVGALLCSGYDHAESLAQAMLTRNEERGHG